MSADRDADESDLLDHVLLPVANEEDAWNTALELEPYHPAKVTAMHVVEKGEGTPDKTPVEQSQRIAEDSYVAVRRVFPEANDYTGYGRDIVATIFAAAEDVDATAIAYRSRGGNRLMHFLSGDLSLKLVTQADRPVIALPRIEDG